MAQNIHSKSSGQASASQATASSKQQTASAKPSMRDGLAQMVMNRPETDLLADPEQAGDSASRSKSLGSGPEVQVKADLATMTRQRSYTTPQPWIDRALAMIDLPTSSFHEQNVMHYLKTFVAQYDKVLTYRLDKTGNVLIDYTPTQSDTATQQREPIVFSAHLDHPGFWAVEMQDEKTLLAYWVGRVPDAYILGANVVFYTGGELMDGMNHDMQAAGQEGNTAFRLGGKPVKGKVTRLCGINEEKDVTRVEIEVESAVLPGSVGVWDLPDAEVMNGKIYGGAVDDVAGCAALVCMLEELINDECPVPVTCLFTRAEEGGFLGCIDYCRDVVEQREQLRQKLAKGQAVDPATIPPNVAGRNFALPKIIGLEMSMMLRDAPQGSGPIVRVGDKRSVFGPHVTDWCFSVARELALKDPTFRFQRKLMDGGTCESSVFEAFLGNAGGICLAIGNYHNLDRANKKLDREYIDVVDFGNLVRLCVAMVEFEEKTEAASERFREWCHYWSAKHIHLYDNATDMPRGVE